MAVEEAIEKFCIWPIEIFRFPLGRVKLRVMSLAALWAVLSCWILARRPVGRGSSLGPLRQRVKIQAAILRIEAASGEEAQHRDKTQEDEDKVRLSGPTNDKWA